MTVGSVVSACEYINCVILDALGEEINPTIDLYELDVEHLSAKDNIVQIWALMRIGIDLLQAKEKD